LKLDIPYTRYVLANGLTLLVHQDARTPTVTFHLWYHVGSKNEPEGRSGFAHLFEHLMFNGSENFNDDFFKATQKIGATNQNGTTSTDRTNYFQTVPKEALDTILWLESDRMGHLLGAVDQARLNEQRGVVQNEKRQGENQPYGQVNNKIVAATYPKEHPYGHTVIGSMEDLNAATLNDVRDWFKTWYGPANAVLVLAGDITPEEAKAKVEKFFGEIPPGPPPSHPKAWTPRLAESQREVMYDRVAAPRIYRVWNVPELGHHDGELLDVAAYALAGDKNARLTRRLVHDEQIATSVAAANSQSEISGQFRIVVTAKPDADLAYIEKVIDEELAKLTEAGPTSAEILKIQVQTVADMVRQMERASSKASLLATWETYLGDPDAWKTSLERLEAATSSAVAGAAKKWLDAASYTLVVRPFPDYRASGQAVDRSAPPVPGPVADADFPSYRTATLSNGVKVMVAERRDVPLVSVRLLMDTGYPQDFAAVTEGVGPLAVGLLDEGTTTRTGLEIAEQLDRLGAGLFVGGGGETSIVEMSSLKSTLDPVLSIFADVVRNPSFNEADVARLRDQQVQSVRQSLRDPNAIAGRVFSRRVWGETHPYGRAATPESVASITRSDLVGFHRRWFGPNNATFIVVGDTTVEEIVPKLEAAFASWAPVEGRRMEVQSPERPRRPVVYLVDRPGSLQSVILVGSAQPPRKPSDDFRLGVFNSLFGGVFTSRVNMNLREDKGWSYGARSSLGGGRGPRSFAIQAPVQTDATKGALIELRKEISDVVGSRPPSAAEVETAKTNFILGLSSRWETNAAVADSLADIAQFSLPADHYDRFAAGFRAVGLQTVRDAARELIPDDGQVWVVVGDRAKIEAGVKDAGVGEIVIVDVNGDPVK
jgi:zinc protease